MTHVIVMGVGVTGKAVVAALRRRGIDVVALDDRLTDDLTQWAADQGVEVLEPAQVDLASVLAHAAYLLPAPGLPDRHPIFAAAAAAGVEVRSEFDLAAEWDRRPAVAVTGTDGKTTVVTLVQQMLEASGVHSVAVGNTDVPYVEAIDDPAIDVFVVEASSFRLGHSRSFAPRVGAWLNFGPDHLDAHEDLSSYEAAKASIWARMAPGAVAVANRDDAVVSRHAGALAATHPEISVETFGSGPPPTSRDHGIVDDTLVIGGEKLVAVGDLTRSMPHDLLNALAAAAIARVAGALRDAIAATLVGFTGLPHRVQFVGEIDGVRYINDSKATTPHAAAAALGGFESIVLLAGGKNKGLAFDEMTHHIANIKHVVALGAAAETIEDVFAGLVPTSRAASMDEAVDLAARVAAPGDVVLLSPACASYDWYSSYVARGEHFIEIVRNRVQTAQRWAATARGIEDT